MNKNVLLVVLAALLGFTVWGYFTWFQPDDATPTAVSEGQLVDTGHFILVHDKDVVLDERYTLHFHPADGYMLMSDAELHVQGQAIQLAQQAQYDRDFRPFFYHLAADTPSGTQIISAQMGTSGLTMEVRVGLARQSTEIADAANVALLDNNLISHFVILLDAIRAETLDREFTAAVPQALLGLPSKIEGPNSATILSDDVSYQAKRFDVHLGDLVIELYEVDGRLAALFNDAQGTAAYDADLFPQGVERVDGADVSASPEGFVEHELGFSNDGLTFFGTLTLPEGADEPVPAALIIAGSGAVDRDGNAQGLQMDAYRQIAHALAEAGIASYRYDKRGVGESGGIASLASRTDLLSDLKAAVGVLREQSVVDAERIILIGHSEGGYLAPAGAVEEGGVAGVILLAGAARPLDEVTSWQVETVLRLQGAGEDQIAVALEQEDVYITFVEGSSGEWSDYTIADLQAQIPWMTETGANQLLSTPLSLSWLREHYLDEPSETLARLAIPVLAINGGKDLQVPAEEATRIETILRDAGNPDVTGIVLEDLNHLLRHHPEEPNFTYRHLDEPVDSRVLETMIEWILSRFGS